jgi:hypothetical protein
MIPILSPMPRSDRRIVELVGVSRVLAVADDRLAATLATIDPGLPHQVGDAGRMTFLTPFEPGSSPGHWRARARLHGRGPRLVPYATVELDVWPWSRDASEVHVRPVARAPHAWGVRRLRRYLTLAPLATEALVQRLVQHAPSAAVDRITEHERRADSADQVDAQLRAA